MWNSGSFEEKENFISGMVDIPYFILPWISCKTLLQVSEQVADNKSTAAIILSLILVST